MNATAQRTHMTKKIVLMTDVPEDVLVKAQVVIVDGERWHALAPPPYRAHGNAYLEDVMALVDCPVVELPEDLTEEQDRKMAEIVRACSSEAHGVFNLAGLLTGLEALGAVVSR